jgi:hypothetical protein
MPASDCPRSIARQAAAIVKQHLSAVYVERKTQIEREMKKISVSAVIIVESLS